VPAANPSSAPVGRRTRCGSSLVSDRMAERSAARPAATRARPGWTVARRARMPPFGRTLPPLAKTGSLHRLRRRRAGPSRWFRGRLTVEAPSTPDASLSSPASSLPAARRMLFPQAREDVA
jgi:hypothetical protein